MKKRAQDTCRCKAYMFPHRVGSGLCTAKDVEGPFCGDCGCSCTANIVDNGIGRYEYWCYVGIDERLEIESSCCNAPCYTNQALTINVEFADIQEGDV